MCPLKAAEVRGAVSKCVADAARTGRVCGFCGHNDHREEHHRLGAADANYALVQGRVSWSGSKGNRDPPPPPPPAGAASAGVGSALCKVCKKPGKDHGFHADKFTRNGEPMPKWCTPPDKDQGGGSGKSKPQGGENLATLREIPRAWKAILSAGGVS